MARALQESATCILVPLWCLGIPRKEERDRGAQDFHRHPPALSLAPQNELDNRRQGKNNGCESQHPRRTSQSPRISIG